MRAAIAFLAATSLSLSATEPVQAAGYRGETVTCIFPTAGKVVLDTREPGASITHAGTRYPATSGSYFYQTETANISMAFNPAMTRWTLTRWDAKDPQPEKAKRCKRSKNRR
jgi:hypothetical protein